MVIPTSSLTNLYGFPVGRRVFVLREVEKRARARGLPAIADKAAQGVAHDSALLTVGIRRRAGSSAVYGVRAMELDNQIDHAVTGFDAFLDSQARLFLNEPRGEAAAHFRHALLPGGPGAVIRLPYTQQHAEIDAMLARLEEPDLVTRVGELPEIVPMAGRLRTLNQQYGDSLNEYDRQPSSDDMRAADARGQELLAETLTLLLAHFISNAPDDHEGRAYLLEPILRQNEAIRASRRRRRKPRDVDPDTGVELPETDPPVENEPPAV